MADLRTPAERDRQKELQEKRNASGLTEAETVDLETLYDMQWYTGTALGDR